MFDFKTFLQNCAFHFHVLLFVIFSCSLLHFILNTDDKLVAFFEKESSAKKVTRGFAPRPHELLKKVRQKESTKLLLGYEGGGIPPQPPSFDILLEKGSKGLGFASRGLFAARSRYVVVRCSLHCYHPSGSPSARPRLFSFTSFTRVHYEVHFVHLSVHYFMFTPREFTSFTHSSFITYGGVGAPLGAPILPLLFGVQFTALHHQLAARFRLTAHYCSRSLLHYTTSSQLAFGSLLTIVHVHYCTAPPASCSKPMGSSEATNITKGSWVTPT